jgi:hypothetical protein
MPRRVTGEMLKAEGMARVDEHANEAWKAAAQRAVLEAARALPQLTADDVMARIDPSTKTRDRRALGPVMTRAAKAGWIEQADVLPVKCGRPSRHAAPITVWKSLLFADEQFYRTVLSDLEIRRCIMSCLTLKPMVSGQAR